MPSSSAVYRAIPARAFVSATHSPEPLPSCTVWETEKAPVDTGLVDVHGVTLYRMPDVQPLGFVARPKK